MATKTAVNSSSSSTSTPNEAPQQSTTTTTQPPVVPPLVLASKVSKNDKKSQNSFAVVNKKVSQNKDDARRVTRHSPQNSTNNTETNSTGSPSKSTAANATNGRTSSPSPSSSSLSPNKINSKQMPAKQVFAHKRSPSSPVPPNPFSNSNQVRATKSKPIPPQKPSIEPMPNLKANFIAAQKSKTETNSVPKVEAKRPKRKLESKKSTKSTAAPIAPPEENGEPRASKRVRLQYQPFQSPEPLPLVPFIYRTSALVAPKKEEEDKVIIYHNNEFLAVRNETNGFFICRAKQNVFKNSRKFKIQWFNNDKNPLVYISDFYDVTDFECILTNLTLFRVDNGQYELPEDEKQRILNILQRAINVEKGINERPDPIKVTADGVDVSVVGKVDEKELLKKISPKRVKKEVIKPKKSLSSASSGSVSSNSTPKTLTRVSKRNTKAVKSTPPTSNSPSNKTMATRRGKTGAIRRSGRSTGSKTPNLSPASSKSSPKEKKPGIAEVVKKLTTRARTAKKLEAKYKKKSLTPTKKTKRALSPKKKSPKMTPIAVSKKSKIISPKPLTPSPKSRKRFTLTPNLSVTLYEKNPFFESTQSVPFVSTLADSRLLIRAVLLKDYNLLSKLMSDKKKICSFCVPRCLAIDRDALSYAIEAEDLRAIKLLTDEALAKNLAPFPDLMLSGETTGHGSKYMFGHALRAVNVSRGGKEGNNALIKDSSLYGYGCARNVSYFDESVAIDALKFGIKFFTIEKLCAQSKSHSDQTMNLFLENIVKAVQNGHCRLAHDLIDRAIKKDGFGFNELHRQSLSSGKQFSAFRSISICKKAIGNSRITPIHCAAINPDPYFLTTLLTQKPDYSIVDTDNWTPIHYAAVSEGSSNLEFLLTHGVSTLLLEKLGNTPLHLACLRNRVRNVELILRHESNSSSDSGPTASTLEKLNRKGLTPLHIAAQEGFVDVVKALIKAGADAEKPTATNIDKLTPLMVAAQFGHLSVIKLLNECGVNIEAVDKKHRTALTHAVMNGQSHVVSYLLRLGANPNSRDSSGNTLIHYACAYGWYFCFKLLIEAKAKPNEMNDWKMSPLCIAFMKGHTGLAEVIIKETDVNIDIAVNDTTGMNLLMQTCESKPNDLMIDRLKFLIERGADCSKTDFENNNALHYLVENESRVLSKYSYGKDDEKFDEMDGEEFYDPLQDREMMARKQELRYLATHHKEVRELQRQKILEASQILIDNNCDPNAVNKKNMSPFMLAAKFGAFSLLHKLLDMNRKQLNSQINSDGNCLLHLFVSHANTQITVQNRKTSVAKFIRDIYESDESLKTIFREMSAISNKSGLKPIHQFLQTFSGQYSVEDEEILLDFLRFLVETLESDINSAIISEKPENIEYVIHLTAKCKTKSFVELILSKKPNLEQLNGTKRTALAIAIINRNIEVSKQLIESGADVKFKSQNDSNQSILLMEAINNTQTFELIPILLSKGALVNESELKSGNTALHYIVSRVNQKYALAAIEALVKSGADINAVNKNGRTPLHLAVNSRHGGTDESFEVEIYLLNSGAKIDIRDERGRIPLHYAFIKIGAHKDHSHMDPIELVALLVPSEMTAIQQPSADVADNFGSTPLHYAAQRGATISCMHLLRAVNINPIDNNDNTPLGLAVLYRHQGCALMLQQKGASFVKPVGNLNRKPDLRYTDDKSCWKWNRLKEEERLNREVEAKKANCSIIEEVVRNDWQGILYLMINELTTMGRGVSVAIESALKTNRLNLAIKLLKRLKNNRSLNTSDQTLLHIMAKECVNSTYDVMASTSNGELQQQIVKLLVEHEVQPLALDSHFKSNAIIYAAINWNSCLCNELTQVLGLDKVVALEPDSLLRTPISALFWDLHNKSQQLPEDLQFWMTRFLEKNSKQLNVLSHYPITESGYGGVRLLVANPSPTNISSFPQYSPLIFAVICGNYSVVKYLLNLKINGSFVVDVNFADNLGRTPLMHSVRLNDLKMVKLLLNRSYSPEDDKKAWDSRSLTFENKNGVDLIAKDRNGWTVLHFLVCPLPNLTYLNSDVILRLLWHVLNNSKPEVQLFEVPNANNETPFQIAVKRNAKSLIKTFNELLENDKSVDESNVDLIGVLPEFPKIETNFLSETFDSKSDSQKMMENIDSEVMDVDNSEPMFKADGLVAIDNANVVIDTTLDLPFDVLLTKVDLEYGIYGLYNFYKMQIIEQKTKDLVLLFTRWGRIGDIGQYQKTPFPSIEEATKEFKKIFKAKSGNNWESVKQFNAVPKKYRLVDLQRRVRQKQRQYKVDLQSSLKSVKSKLPVPLFELMKSLISVHSAKDALRSYGNSEAFTPFGVLKNETLQKAENVLTKIEELIEEKESIKEKNSNDYSRVTLDIIDLSEQFYHLIPLFGYQYERLSPLLSREDLRDKMELIFNLTHFEFAFELLLGAQLRQQEVNPADYVYKCLNSHLHLLDRNEEESQLILQYIHNTGNRSLVKNIFKINRNGEEQTFKNVGNNWMLWHGTKVTNVLSILANGLKKAPLGAEISGHLFGKGIYFADMFTKSQNYCSGFGTEFNGQKFMFLCEVSLGNIEDVRINGSNANILNALNKDKHSLKTSHTLYRPDPQTSVYWKGRSVPLGPSVRNHFENNEYHELNYNEYIVMNCEQICLRYLIQFSD